MQGHRQIYRHRGLTDAGLATGYAQNLAVGRFFHEGQSFQTLVHVDAIIFLNKKLIVKSTFFIHIFAGVNA